MRVLFIGIDVPVEGGSGGQIASWRLLESYASFATVDVLILAPPSSGAADGLSTVAERHAVVPVEAFHFASARLRLTATFAASQFGGKPYRHRKFEAQRARDILAEWLRTEHYSLLHCDQLSTVPYRQAVPDVPAVLMEQNVEWQLLDRLAEVKSNPVVRRVLRREARRTRAWELDSVRSMHHTFTLTASDRAALLGADPRLDAARVSVWPLPVASSATPLLGPSRGLNVLVMGSLRSLGRLHGLEWFLREVWPNVRRENPDARLDIVGASPPKAIAELSGSDGIRVHGFVDDLGPILTATHVCAAPLFAGGGIRVKMLEMVSRGIPCIGTPIAVEGFDSTPGVTSSADPAFWSRYFTALRRHPERFRSEALEGSAELAQGRSVAAARQHLAEALTGFASSVGGSANPLATPPIQSAAQPPS